ncbi:MAG: hypothetical protein C0603_08725 [Denitrovibrio sp.]|nr:MAG: hypothetical protein C0603_08725 [Denitrovibrio sp.]
MSSVIEDLYSLVEDELGSNFICLQITRNLEIVASIGEQVNYAHFIEIPSNCYKATVFFDKMVIPSDKSLGHIRKIFNIHAGAHLDTSSRLFSGAEILDTIINKSTVDEVLKKLVSTLVGNGGFCRAGIMFLNEALLELRGVICADLTGDMDLNRFRSCKLNFKTKNQLSDIMFYDRTDVVQTGGSEGLDVLDEFFCENVMVTGLGVGDRPIGILLACKENYDESDKEALLLYGNICSLSIEFSKTMKQLELTTADLGNLRKTAVNSENLVKMGQLSATVAHELKNPLVAIGGFTKRMEQTAVNPQTKNYIKIVQ